MVKISTFQKVVYDPLDMVKVSFSHIFFLKKKVVYDPLGMTKVSISHYFPKKCGLWPSRYG